MSAETGVGPSIASGSQTWSGNCADLPQAPAKTHTAAAVSHSRLMSPARAISRISWMLKVCVCVNRIMMPISSPTSPMRVVMNAFFAASAADGRSL